MIRKPIHNFVFKGRPLSTGDVWRKGPVAAKAAAGAKPSASPGLTLSGGVHGSQRTAGSAQMWRNKPLFTDRVFKTGSEASRMLIEETKLRDTNSPQFLSAWTSMSQSLAVVFDRMPKYAWVMKQLMDPDRMISFRVAWIDDSGISRVDRGFRCQYSSALGPYEGGLAFGSRVTEDRIRAQAFDSVFSNALSGKTIGGAYGGSTFNPYTKSETEIQRFCQSYMTELSKYIGPDKDLPGMGEGVGPSEIGYLYGQYKRINQTCGQIGQGLLWGGSPMHIKAQGYGVVYFAKKMLADKGMSLAGKRCLITGSHYVALAVAEKLVELGAIPLTLTDASGVVYEPDGFDAAKVKTVAKIKGDRGARVGRYIVASTSAKFLEPSEVYKIPCDLVFPLSSGNYQITEADIAALSANGCQGIIEGVQQPVSNEAIVAAKKKGMMHAPYRATIVGGSIINGMTLANEPLQHHVGETLDSRVEGAVNDVYEEIKSTAKEFNTRGDLNAGANIAAFLRVADVMVAHGVV